LRREEWVAQVPLTTFRDVVERYRVCVPLTRRVVENCTVPVTEMVPQVETITEQVEDCRPEVRVGKVPVRVFKTVPVEVVEVVPYQVCIRVPYAVKVLVAVPCPAPGSGLPVP